MQRRGFLGVLGSALTAPLVAKIAEATPEPTGVVEVPQTVSPEPRTLGLKSEPFPYSDHKRLRIEQAITPMAQSIPAGYYVLDDKSLGPCVNARLIGNVPFVRTPHGDCKIITAYNLDGPLAQAIKKNPKHKPGVAVRLWYKGQLVYLELSLHGIRQNMDILYARSGQRVKLESKKWENRHFSWRSPLIHRV